LPLLQNGPGGFPAALESLRLFALPRRIGAYEPRTPNAALYSAYALRRGLWRAAQGQRTLRTTPDSAALAATDYREIYPARFPGTEVYTHYSLPGALHSNNSIGLGLQAAADSASTQIESLAGFPLERLLQTNQSLLDTLVPQVLLALQRGRLPATDPETGKALTFGQIATEALGKPEEEESLEEDDEPNADKLLETLENDPGRQLLALYRTHRHGLEFSGTLQREGTGRARFYPRAVVFVRDERAEGGLWRQSFACTLADLEAAGIEVPGGLRARLAAARSPHLLLHWAALEPANAQIHQQAVGGALRAEASLANGDWEALAYQPIGLRLGKADWAQIGRLLETMQPSK
jgi:hypothetical protein